MKSDLKTLMAPLFLWVAALAALAPQASAQSSSIRFRTLSWQGDIKEIHYQHRKGEVKEIEACDYVRSLPYQATAGADLIFFKLEKNKEGENVRKEVGRIPAAKLVDDLLVLISLNREGYHFTAMPEDARAFPPDSYRILNASNVPLAARVGSKVVKDIAPGTSCTLQADLSDGEKGVTVQIAQIAINTQKGELVYSNRLAVRSGQRTLIFAKASGNERRQIETKRIVESSNLPGSQP